MWTQVANNAPERTLTLDDYKEVGGLAGALSKHCDEILQELNTEQQRIAQVMFRALCERSSEQRDTRRPVRLGEVATIADVNVEAVIPVVDAFRGMGRNFLMPSLPTLLARIIHQPQKSTRESAFEVRIARRATASPDHPDPKTSPSGCPGSVQIGRTVAIGHTASSQPA